MTHNVPRRFLSELTVREQQARTARRLTDTLEKAQSVWDTDTYKTRVRLATEHAPVNERGFLTYPGMEFVAEYLEAWIEADLKELSK